jgi:hypothetical protein
LSPVEQSRELDPLDSVLDSEPQKHTVEIGFDGAFRHFQLTGDFGVVTSLKKQIDDLLLPASQQAELLVHALYLTATQGITGASDSRFVCPSYCNHAAKIGASPVNQVLNTGRSCVYKG